MSSEATDQNQTDHALRQARGAPEEAVPLHARTRRALTTQLELVVEQVPAHLWTTDADLCVTSVSGTLLSSLGVDPTSYVGEALPALLPQTPPVLVLDAHQIALGGNEAGYELTFRGRLLACRVRPLRNEQGEVLGCVGLALDVTERRGAERRLVIEREVTEALGEAADLREAAPRILRALGEGLGWDYGGLWTVDRDGNVLRQEDTWQARGVDVSEFIATSRDVAFARGEGLPGSVWATAEPRWIVDIADEARFPRLRSASAAGLRSGFALSIRLNGRVVAVIEFLSCELRHPDPDVLEMVTALGGVLGHFMERKKAEEALQAHTRQQQAVAALGEYALATPDLGAVMDEAVVVIARTLDVEYCKVLELLPGGEALWLRAGVGWAKGLVGRTMVPSGADSQAGYTLRVETPIIVGDLRSEHRFSGPPLLREHGVVSGMSVIVPGLTKPFGVLGAHTITQRTFTDDDVHFLQAVANVLAAALRRRDTEERLGRERAEAERLVEVDRLRSEFVALVSHELKTPLTAIRASVGLLETSAVERLRSEEQELLTNTRLSAQQLGILIDDLLAYNQLAAGTLQFDPQPVDLREVVGSAMQAVQSLFQEKDQRLAVDLPSPLPVLGSTIELEQVVINLLANANRHTPSGAQITVAGWVAGQHVRLSVADTGLGVPDEELEAIFRRFYRPRTTPTAGSGLGLAIARELVERHGGRIWAESEPGQGMTVRVTLPMREEVSESYH
jgi:signal transduction histidine kinase